MGISRANGESADVIYRLSQASESHSFVNLGDTIIAGVVVDNIGEDAEHNPVVTFGAQTFTKIAGRHYFGTSGGRNLYLFQLSGAIVGTDTLAVVIDTVVQVISVTAYSYNSVADVSSQPDFGTEAFAFSAGTIATATTTTLTDGCWLVGLFLSNLGDGTAGAGTVISSPGTMANSGIVLADSGGPITPAGSASLIIQAVSGYQLNILMVALKPAGGSGPVIPRFMNQYRHRR